MNNQLLLKLILLVFLIHSCDVEQTLLDQNEVENTSTESELSDIESENEFDGTDLEDQSYLNNTLAMISENVSVKKATKISGNPPQPQGNLIYELNEQNYTAFLTHGFDLKIENYNPYVGAYIQFKDADGNPTNSYWDFDFKGFEILSDNLNGQAMSYSKSSNLTHNEIDIDFGEGIVSGYICCDLYLYNAQGAVADPVEYCVDILPWGGDTDTILGDWKLVEESSGDFSEKPGEEKCPYLLDINCVNGSTFKSEYSCYSLHSDILSLKSDGTFEQTKTTIYKTLDKEKSELNCTAIYLPSKSETDITRGRWTYDSFYEKISLVTFEALDEDRASGEITEYIYETGSVLHQNAIVDLRSNSLSIDDIDQTVTLRFEK